MYAGAASSAENGDPRPARPRPAPPSPYIALPHRYTDVIQTHCGRDLCPTPAPRPASPICRMCAPRWDNHLDPHISKADWSKAEERTLSGVMLLYLSKELRRRTIPWTEIQKEYFPGRMAAWSKSPLRVQS